MVQAHWVLAYLIGLTAVVCWAWGAGWYLVLPTWLASMTRQERHVTITASALSNSGKRKHGQRAPLVMGERINAEPVQDLQVVLRLPGKCPEGMPALAPAPRTA